MGETGKTSYRSDAIKEVEEYEERSRKKNTFNDFSYFSHAIIQRLRRRRITAEVRVQTQTSPCRIDWERRGNWTGLCPSISILFNLYQSPAIRHAQRDISTFIIGMTSVEDKNLLAMRCSSEKNEFCSS
jgi:hypothetical protein